MDNRIINTEKFKETIIDMIYKTNFELSYEVEERFREMSSVEVSFLAKKSLDIIEENASISKVEEIPLCQDCGIVIIFLEIGQEVILQGDPIEVAINDAVSTAYKKFNLRKSVVADPLNRVNTGTNTPSFIHYDIVPGRKVKLTVYLKGGGSENMSSLKMFKPTVSVDMILDHIEETVIEAGPNPCPPIFLGVGIGGSADIALVNSKKAVLRGIRTGHPNPFYRDLEVRLEDRLNRTNIGPLGFGGVSTVGGVYIKEAPTHIASLPVALNMNCHSLRYRIVEL